MQKLQVIVNNGEDIDAAFAKIKYLLDCCRVEPLFPVGTWTLQYAPIKESKPVGRPKVAKESYHVSRAYFTGREVGYFDYKRAQCVETLQEAHDWLASAQAKEPNQPFVILDANRKIIERHGVPEGYPQQR